MYKITGILESLVAITKINLRMQLRQDRAVVKAVIFKFQIDSVAYAADNVSLDFKTAPTWR